MCDFISWIEHDKEIYFLTSDHLATKEGRELLKIPGMASDIMGHGALRRYLNPADPDRKWGVERECSDFSSPKNFPAVIVKAIKSGKFAGLGICPDILTPPALAEYQRVKGPALAEYQRVKGPALAEYERVAGPAWAEYQRVAGTAWAEYERVKGPALAEYQRVAGTAWAEYERVAGPAFWDIARQKKNRRKEWK